MYDKLAKQMAKNVKDRAEIVEKKKELDIHEKEKQNLYNRMARDKRQADIDHKNYLKEKQRLQDKKDFDNSNEGRRQKSFGDAKENEARDIKMGLSRDERAYKNMDYKEKLDCRNAIAQGEVKDITAFQKRQRLQQEASERNRRRLKGL